MNWLLVEQNWPQFKGVVKARWFQFSDEQLQSIGGKRPQLLAKIQETYGVSRAMAEREIKTFEARNKNFKPKN